MTWNTVKEGAVFSASVVVLLGAVAVVYELAVNRSLDNLLGFLHGALGSPQSPIRVVGGSIKLAASGWGTLTTSCGAFSSTSFMGQNIRNCIISNASVDFSTLSLAGAGLFAANGNQTATKTPAGTSWIGLDSTWTIVAYARGTSNAKGIDICVTSVSGTKGKIAIAAFDNTNANSMTAAQLFSEEVEQGDATVFGYHDPTYKATHADANTPSTLLEYMGQLSVTIGGQPNNYNCYEGLCQIYIGN
jgi:hypothetical protein